MYKISLHNKKIAVLGYGVEGRGTVEYLLKHGYKDITVFDEREDIDLPPGVLGMFGRGVFQQLVHYQVIFRAPGIYRRRPELLRAEAAGAVITSQLEFFLSKAVCSVIGVTGTKGKSTTTSLLHHIFTESGQDAYLAGNIGHSILGLLDEVSVRSIVVLELSSFQLQDIRLSPRVAIVLGVTPEHLDVHATVEEYAEAKSGLVRHQRAGDILLCAPDNVLATEIASTSAATQRWSWCPDAAGSCTLPEDAQLGITYHEGTLWFQTSDGEEEVMDRRDVPLLGEHMLQNVMPAMLCAYLHGVESQDIARAVRSFPGVPHRMENLGEARGMLFFNDSAATTPEAAMAAVDAHAGTPTMLILGGGQKGVSLKDLAQHVSAAEHIHHIILAGNDAAATLQTLFAESSPHGAVHHVDTYESLPQVIAEYGAPGMHVVLAPGCTSFDLFRDYKARGEAFRSVVSVLQEK